MGFVLRFKWRVLRQPLPIRENKFGILMQIMLLLMEDWCSKDCTERGYQVEVDRGEKNLAMADRGWLLGGWRRRNDIEMKHLLKNEWH